MNHRQAILLLIITAALWSIGGVLIKSINLHPLAIAGARSTVAACVLAVAARRFQFTWDKAQLGSMFFFAYTVISFVTATKLTTAANAILLQYTAPVYVAVLSGPLLNERVTKRDWIALVAVLCGMAVFFMGKLSPENFWGNVVALTSGFGFAGLALCLRMQKGHSTFESLLLGHLLTAIIGLPFLLSGPLPNGQEISFLLLLGVVQLGIPYVLYAIAIRHVTALEASLIPVLEPVLNPIWVAVFTGEVPAAQSYFGGAIVIGAVLWQATAGKWSLKKAVHP